MKRLLLIRAILVKDFLDSYKNRTVFFSIIFPVLLSMIFRIVFSQGEITKLHLAVINGHNTPVVEFIRKTGLIEVEETESFDSARSMLEEGRVQGIIELPDNFEEKMDRNRTQIINLWVDGAAVGRAAALEMILSKLFYHYRGQSPPVEIIPKPIQGSGFKYSTAMLPTWLLFIILGGFMIVSSSIIEERDKKTLQAILVTHCELSDILIGKGLLGFLLTMAGALLVLALNGGFMGSVFANMLIIICGAAFFSVLGVMIGLLMPGQTSSNTFGSLLYMVMFMPVVLAEANKKMLIFARFLPSYYINDGIRQAMFANASAGSLSLNFAYLVILGLAMFAVSIYILKNKENI